MLNRSLSRRTCWLGDAGGVGHLVEVGVLRGLGDVGGGVRDGHEGREEGRDGEGPHGHGGSDPATANEGNVLRTRNTCGGGTDVGDYRVKRCKSMESY